MEKRIRGRKNSAIMEVHLGKILSEKIKEGRLSKSEVARSIGRPPTAIKPLLNRPSMQAYLLWELSIAMNYDFFATLSSGLQQKHPGIQNEHAVIIALQKELAGVKQERDSLKRLVELLGK